MSAPRSVIALYDNRAEYPDELSFKKGDILELLDDTSNPDWWMCKFMGRTGIAPANRLKSVVPQVPQKIHREPAAASSSNEGLRLASSPTGSAQGNYEEIPDYDFPRSLRKSGLSGGAMQAHEEAPDTNYINLSTTAQEIERLRLREQAGNWKSSEDYENSALYQNLGSMPSSSDYCNLPRTRQAAASARPPVSSPSPQVVPKMVVSPSNSKSVDEADEASANYSMLPSSKPMNLAPSVSTTASLEHEYDKLPTRGTLPSSPSKAFMEANNSIVHDYQVPPNAASQSSSTLSPPQTSASRSRNNSELNIEVAYAHALAIDMDAALQRATLLCEREFQKNSTRLFAYVRAGWKSQTSLSRISKDLRVLVVTLVRNINELERFGDGVCANAHILDDRRLSKELDRAVIQLRTAALDSAAHRDALDSIAAEASLSANSDSVLSAGGVTWHIDALFANSSLAAQFDSRLDAFVNTVRDAAIVVRTFYALVRGNLRALFSATVLHKVRERQGGSEQSEAAAVAAAGRFSHARSRSDASRLLDAENYEVVVPDSELDSALEKQERRCFPVRSDSRLIRSASTDALDSRADGEKTRVRRTANDSPRIRSTPQASAPDLRNLLSENVASVCKVHDQLQQRIEQLIQSASRHDSPIAMVECTKQVVLVAYNLIYAGDAFRQQVDTVAELQSDSDKHGSSANARGERIGAILGALCAQLKTLLISAKQAALEFPNAERLRKLLDEAACVTRSANELRTEATQLEALD